MRVVLNRSVVTTALSLLLLLGCGDRDIGSSDDGLLGTQRDPATPSPGPPVPLSGAASLSPSQVEEAKSIVNSDATIQRLLPDGAFVFGRIGPWTHVKDNGLIGAVVELRLAAPLSTSDTIPMLQYDEAEVTPPYYTSLYVRVVMTSVSVLTVSVDLNVDAVVAMHPDPDARLAVLDPIPTRSSRGD